MDLNRKKGVNFWFVNKFVCCYFLICFIDMIFSMVYKVKGLEFNIVKLMDDFNVGLDFVIGFFS